MLTEHGSSAKKKTKRVAVIHDWLFSLRGGEVVLEAILDLFPEATVFCLFRNKHFQSHVLNRHPVIESPFNQLPGVRHYYRYLLPLLPMMIERFDLTGYDLILSSSHCVAKGVIAPPDSLHICYCHSPMRYIWDEKENYFRHPFLRWATLPFLNYLRLWDTSSSSRVDHFIANSHWIGKRIEKYYRRSSFVVHPFVDLDLFDAPTDDLKQGDYYLVVSGFAPYKRIDLAIEACESLGRRLLIIGDGQDKKYLRRLAGKNTEFLGRVSRKELRDLYRHCRALLFPGREDFGIVPLEAMASGRPIIAYAKGGALETVIPHQTGIFFESPSVDSLKDAILTFEMREGEFSAQVCRKQALKFSKQSFQSQLKQRIEDLLSEA